MSMDAITIAAVADEWRKLLIGARIDTIIQPTEYAVALQCYAPNLQGQGGQNRWIYLSAHPQLARAHITALKPQKIASEPPPFVMLLRKHLEGARIESIVQPRWERVVEIIAGYRSSPDSDERIRFRIIVEIMGRMSNIIFCDEKGLILGSLKRVGADINRYRTIAAGVQYVPPPPQQRALAGQLLPRLEPTTVTAAQLSICAAAERSEEPAAGIEKKRKRAPEKPKLWQLLSRHLLGCSPLLAREFVFRTTEESETFVDDVNQDVWEELAWNVRDISAVYDSHRWQPQLIERSAESEDQASSFAPPGQVIPVAFAPYVLEQYAQLPHVQIRQSPSINVLLDDYFARTEWRDAVESLRAPLRKVLQTQRDRCKRKAEHFQQEMALSQEANSYRLYGELLLAHQNEVQQGEVRIEIPNFFEYSEDGEAPLVAVPLDPRFGAVDNANRYFNKYHKLRRALELVPAQIEQNDTELATVEQLLADLKLAENAAEIAHVKAEVQAAGYIRGKAALDKKALKAAKKGKGGKQSKGKPVPPGGGVPLHVQSREGFTLLIGKNSRQNEEVTFHQATANDIWLHARGVAGAHVIVKAAGRQVPHSTIEQAARLAAYYSEARGSTSAPVDHTLQRHVRHMKGGGPGMVTYEREQTLYVEPDKALQLIK
ncbi:MAG: NFACT family protein [Ktedonobacteraceae bacterium]|nr:NFACT family protein [Ktedonobacteraceae bacterium]